MATELTKEQFVEILQDSEIIRPKDLAVFQTIYSFGGHRAYASQVGRILGNKGKMPGSPINLQVGSIAKRIAKKHDIDFTVRQNLDFKYWDLFFDGWKEKQFWVWQLRPNLKEALEEAELTGDKPYPEEVPNEFLTKIFEGAKRTITVNSYERNPLARRLCIEHYGAKCVVCDFNFEKEYGEIGKGFIHVHHLTRVSDIRQEYEIDPIQDLRPVCPNCHSMLHSDKDTLTIDELRNFYQNADGRATNYR